MPSSLLFELHEQLITTFQEFRIGRVGDLGQRDVGKIRLGLIHFGPNLPQDRQGLLDLRPFTARGIGLGPRIEPAELLDP